MDSMYSASNYLKIMTLFFLFSCANQGVPSGGEKDETAPKILKSSPQNYSISFDKKRITLLFDEFVALKDVKKNFTISPPQKKQPRIRLKERAIVIDIRDSLIPKTTYSLDFGQAIVDNNEGNPLGEYRYVFSTGEVIDSLSLAGYVYHSEKYNPAEEVVVGLFHDENPLDSLYQKIPNYIATTDSIGFFMFTNIADKSYRMLTFKDQNNNQMLDENEPVGFLKERVFPSESMTTSDDSLRIDKYTLFKNTNIKLSLCKPIANIQYLKDYKRLKRNQLLFVFNAPLKDSLGVKLINTEANPNFIVEDLRNQDSLFYWLIDTNVTKKDTLFAQLSFLKTNKKQQLEPFLDTVKLIFKDKKHKSRKKRDKDKKAKPKIDFMKIKTNIEEPYDYFKPLEISFEMPIITALKEKVSLFQPIDSVTVNEKEFTLTADSILPHRRFYLSAKLKADTSYVLKIDSAAIKTIDYRFNNTFEQKFSTQREGYYGKIFVNVTGGDESVMMELLNKDDSDKVVATLSGKISSSKYAFVNIPKGTYQLRVFWDENGNGKWDDGNLRKKQYPEAVRMFKKEIKLPANWEIEVAWTLKK